MAEYVGAIPVYLTDTVAFHPNWLSLDPPHDETQIDPGTQEEVIVTVYGEPIIPVVDTVYMILTDGEYCHRLVTFNGTVYRLITKVNTMSYDDALSTRRFIDVDGETQVLSLPEYRDSGRNYSVSHTFHTIREEDRRFKFNLHKLNISDQYPSGRGNVRLYIGSTEFAVEAANGSWMIRTYDVQDGDVGKKISIVNTATTSGSSTFYSGISADSYVEITIDYVDTETEDYVPNTDIVVGQAGLIPPASAATNAKVFTSSGWGDSPLDITAEEIKTIFDNATGTTTTYNGTEFIIGEFNGKTLYESRLPLSDISGNDLNSFEFTAHKMIDGRLALPTRLIDLSINKSGDQWAVSPVVSLSADEKQNGTLIIEYTKE